MVYISGKKPSRDVYGPGFNPSITKINKLINKIDSQILKAISTPDKNNQHIIFILRPCSQKLTI